MAGGPGSGGLYLAIDQPFVGSGGRLTPYAAQTLQRLLAFVGSPTSSSGSTSSTSIADQLSTLNNGTYSFGSPGTDASTLARLRNLEQFIPPLPARASQGIYDPNTVAISALTQAIYGNVVPDTYFANNPTLATGSTAGIFWTATDAQNSGNPAATVNADTLFELARAYSVANNAEILFRGINYTLNQSHATFTGGERFRGDPGGNTWFLVAFGATNAPACLGSYNGMTAWVEDIQLRWINIKPIRSTYQDFMTGLLATDPNIETTITMGDWTGLTNYGPMIASATRPSLKGGTTIALDALPLGYTSVTAANAALIGASIATPKLGAITIVSPGFQAATDGAGTYYTVTVGSALIRDLPGAIAAQPFVPATSSAPEIWPVPAYPAVTMYLLSGAPTFYASSHFSFLCNDFVAENCISEGSGGRSWLIGGRGRGLNVRVRAPTTHPDTAGFRYIGSNLPGGAFIADNFDIVSNDDAGQCVPGTTYGAKGFSANSNLDATIYYNGGRFVSFGGRAIIAGVSVPNGAQHAAWPTTGGLAVGNTLTLPLANIPAGLTVAMLQASAAPYSNTDNYSTTAPGFLVANAYSGNIYSLTTPGVPNPNGNGPTGTGAGIVDGTCVWSFVQVGVTQQVYYGTPGVIATLAYVVAGTVSSGGTVTIPIAAPGVTNAIETAVAAGPSINVNFVVGIPPVIFTNSLINKATGVFLRTYSESAIVGASNDTQGSVRVEVDQFVIDNRLGFNIAPSVYGAVTLTGGTYNTGGTSLSLKNGIVYGANTCALNVQGNVPKLDIDNVYFYPIRNNTQNYAPYIVAGVQAGGIRNSTLWGQPAGATYPGESMTVGLVSSTTFGLAVNNQASDFNFDCNYLMGQIDNEPFFKVYYAQGALDFTGNWFFQATALGSGNGKGITLNATVTAGTVITSGNNKFFGIDGPPYNGTLSFLSITANDVVNPSPNPAGANYPFTVPTVIIAGPSAIAANPISSFGSGAATVPASSQPIICVALTQGSTVAAGTLTIPAGAFDQQLMFVRTRSAVTAFSFAGAACSWTNGTTLAAGTGIVLMWNLATTTWWLASVA